MPVCPACGEDNPAQARFCMSCAAPFAREAPAPPGARKVVTVLFCDVADSTPLGERLDPESVREVMSRFFAQMRTILELHGGTVEKYIGDAVMAVFGVPLLHEDDAVRAVRAAAGMRESLAALNAELEPRWGVTIQVRIGINTGEVVVGDQAAGQALVVGDAVNLAARLEQTASPGEVLIGRDTFVLVRDAVTAEAVEPLSLKGKRDPVVAYRLVDLRGAGIDARIEPPFVGREPELAELRATFDLVAASRGRRLLTILGPAGVGKSRVAREFVGGLGDEALVLEGRCLPYGDGITFWPVAEVVKQACGITEGDSRRRARSRIDAMLAGAAQAALVSERVAAVVGFAEAAVGIHDTFWAIRRFLEWLGREQPLVVVFDDIQWAEPTFLDLVEYLAGWTAGVSLLLLCMSRPELLDDRSTWGTGAFGSDSITLAPLSIAESELLVVGILGDVELNPAALARITEAADGNPLFVEEMLRMLEDDGFLRREDGRWEATGDLSSVAPPATIQSLLSARLDRLTPQERTVIRSASVVGREFWWGAVSELVPEDLRPDVGSHLQTLVRKQLIAPEPSVFAGEDAFRFHHILIQEAAYQGAPKETRADLHVRFADWMARTAGERVVEYEEVLGYHLERAYRYRLELGSATESDRAIAVRAGERLASAGRRALGRGDMSAAADLLGRAAGLYPPDDPARLPLLPDLGEALMETGDLAGADRVLGEAIEGAGAPSDRGVRAHAVVVRLLMLESTSPKERSQEALRELEGVIPVFEELGDDLGLARAWRLTADVHWTRGRYEAVDEALRRAIEHARRAGAAWEEVESLGQYTGSGVYGPAPVPEVAARCHEVLKAAEGNPVVEARALRGLACVRAMEGRPDEAREMVKRARSILEDLGLRLRAAFVSEACGFVERLAGDHAAAERELRSGFEVISELGEQGYLSTAAALIAHEILAQGRFDEAEGFIEISEAAAAEDDLTTQALCRSARGRLLASRGQPEEAEREARAAAALAEETDDINMRGDLLVDLAEVLESAGRSEDAVRELERARELYGRKGNVVSAELVARRIDELRTG